MSVDRRVSVGHPGADRVVIDDVLFERKSGGHARRCCSCNRWIEAEEDRFVPVRFGEAKGLIHGRHTRICVACVEGRLARARGAA